MKLKGKQIRRSLETDDLPLACRRLKELRNDLEVTDPTKADRTLEVNAEKFLSGLAGAESTRDNTKRTIRKLLRDWKGARVISKMVAESSGARRGCYFWDAIRGSSAAGLRWLKGVVTPAPHPSSLPTPSLIRAAFRSK